MYDLCTQGECFDSSLYIHTCFAIYKSCKRPNYSLGADQSSENFSQGLKADIQVSQLCDVLWSCRSAIFRVYLGVLFQ